jgi:hypothetical protein
MYCMHVANYTQKMGKSMEIDHLGHHGIDRRTIFRWHDMYY